MNGSSDRRDADRVGLLADRIAETVAGCPAVADLAAGPVATYLPGRIVRGVAVHDDDVRIAVIARYGPPLAEVAAQVRSAVAPLAPGSRLDVQIDDIQTHGTRPLRTAVGSDTDTDGAECDRTGAP